MCNIINRAKRARNMIFFGRYGTSNNMKLSFDEHYNHYGKLESKWVWNCILKLWGAKTEAEPKLKHVYILRDSVVSLFRIFR